MAKVLKSFDLIEWSIWMKELALITYKNIIIV
jgi:hypothetical protein